MSNLTAYANKSAASPVPLNITTGIDGSCLRAAYIFEILLGLPPSTNCTPGILSIPRSKSNVKQATRVLTFDYILCFSLKCIIVIFLTTIH